jgi:acyl carrier protein
MVINNSTVACRSSLYGSAGAAQTGAAELKHWLITNIAAVLEIDPASVDPRRNLDEYGLDSMQSVCLSGDLETWLGMEVPATAVWDYPTIDALCEYLTERMPARTGSVHSSSSSPAYVASLVLNRSEPVLARPA